MASGPITSWQIDGKTMETDFIWGAPISLQVVTAAMKLKDWKKQAAPWKKSYDKPRQHIQKERHHFANNRSVCIVKAMVFGVVLYVCELDQKEG